MKTDLTYPMLTVSALVLSFSVAHIGLPASAHAPPKVLNDDGGWCWFEDERAIVAGGGIWVGSVANGRTDKARTGDIEVTRYDLSTGRTEVHCLHKNLQADDHNSPALIQRPDGRILAAYSKHGSENQIYSRVSDGAGPGAKWGTEKVFVPSQSSRVTYSNLFRLSGENGKTGRIYDFFRGLDDTFKPSWMWSDDLGETWRTGGLLVDFPHSSKQRPYVKYASVGNREIHFLFTEAHPRNFDNSLYHAYYRDGKLYRTDGEIVRPLREGPILPIEATRIFKGDPMNVVWAHDIHLDANGRPYAAYSVQKDSADMPSGPAGMDLRYRFARWNGSKWLDQEAAFAGHRLYAGEDDYAGGIAVHPRNRNRLFISTNVDPSTGAKVGSGRYEIYDGRSRDDGMTWLWAPLTQNSREDNLRPIVPAWRSRKTALLWLRGRYESYTRYHLQVVLKILE